MFSSAWRTRGRALVWVVGEHEESSIRQVGKGPCHDSRSSLWFFSLSLRSSVPLFIAWVSCRLPSTKQRTPHYTKHMVKLPRATLGSGFCLPDSDPIPHFCHRAESWGWVPVSIGSQKTAEGSSNLGPKPRNDLATRSDICCPVTLRFWKHTLK